MLLGICGFIFVAVFVRLVGVVWLMCYLLLVGLFGFGWLAGVVVWSVLCWLYLICCLRVCGFEFMVWFCLVFGDCC